MQLQDIVNEAIRVRRLTPDSSTPHQDMQRSQYTDNSQPDDADGEDNTGLDDMPYYYGDDVDDPSFDFGDTPQEDGDLDVNFGEDDWSQSDDLNNEIEQSAMSGYDMNSTGLGGASASTPVGHELEQDLANSGEATNDDNLAMKQLADTSTEDPNKQGVLRKVAGTRLIYKRETENGTYEELWAYNVSSSNAPDSFKKRRAILAGTDIPPNKTTSPDGSQSYEIWTTSNAELIRIKGLQN